MLAAHANPPDGLGQKFTSAQVGQASPHGKARVSLAPRAAFSHSASVGSATLGQVAQLPLLITSKMPMPSDS